MSALLSCRLYRSETFRVLISVRGLDDHRAMAWPEGLCQSTTDST